MALYAAIAGLPAQTVAIEPISLPGLPSVRISAVVETTDHRLWFGGIDGLWLHDGHSVQEIELPAAPERLRRVRCLAAVGGDLLVGMPLGLGRIREGEEELELLPWLADAEPTNLGALSDGTVWLRTTSGLFCWRDEQLEPVVQPGASGLAGLVSDATQVWAWDDDSIWVRPLASPHAAWREAMRFPARAMRPDQDGVLAIGPQGVVELAADRPPRWLLHGDHGHEVLRSDGRLWMRDTDVLTVLEAGGKKARQVAFFRGGSPSSDIRVMRLLADSSGLLWLGTQLGVMRINLCAGVENYVIPVLRDKEMLGAMLELHDGRLLVGTNRGQLLEAAPGSAATWHPLTTPWPAQAAIHCMLQDPQQRLWVGTRQHGLWRQGDRGWQRIGDDELLRGVRDLHWHDGQLWACGTRQVLRLDLDTAEVPEVLWSGAGAGSLPSALAVDGRGRVWLGTFHQGLLEFDRGSDSFVAAGLAGDSLLSVDVAPDGRRLVIATPREVWEVDSDSHVTQQWASLGRTAFRELLFAGDGTLWETRSHQLLHVDGRQIREVGPGSGAHPLGYAYRSGLRLSNGDLLFGATRGYTRIRGGASLVGVERTSLRGCEVVDEQTGSIVRVPPGKANLRVSPSFRIAGEVLDRSCDLPLPLSVRLEPLDREGEPLVGEGRFVAVEPGRYHASVEVLEINGATAEISVGELLVVPVGAGAWPWLLSSAAILGLAMLWWRLRRMVAKARRPELERVLAAAGYEADEVLDLAFVVVAAAEGCLQESGASRVSAWIRVGSHEPTLLAQFGAAGTGEQQCVARLSTSGPGWHACECDGHREVVIELTGAGALSFQVLMVGVDGNGETVRQAVERALQPARAALDRSVWVDRLQAFCVNSTLSMEADLHDLRGSLTVLRLGVAELRRERGGLDPVIGSLGRATDALLQAVERLKAPRAVRLELADPLDTVQEVLDGLRGVGAARGISLTLRPCSAPQQVRIDPVWFRRALENVIGNALKYSDNGTRVQVSMLGNATGLRVCVDDAGPGFADEERSGLFLPGVVGKAQPRNGESKTGIGLWVSRQAMRAMGGTLWIEPRPGGGSRVVLQLPWPTTSAAEQEAMT